jgi:hypothetical protein
VLMVLMKTARHGCYGHTQTFLHSTSCQLLMAGCCFSMLSFLGAAAAAAAPPPGGLRIA